MEFCFNPSQILEQFPSTQYPVPSTQYRSGVPPATNQRGWWGTPRRDQLKVINSQSTNVFLTEN
ncbi:hypothetical protein SD81_001680 [Tolypothrix campylonemoides VB511288]|nr:hypothetical protein SD81_001680 [Tolypothrix campylonemoides VB511288]